MRRLVRVFVPVAFVGMFLMNATGASAQDVTVGYQYQRLEGVNFPLGFGADVSFPVNENVSIVGQFDWSRKSESETVSGTSVDASANLSTFGGGVRWTAPGAAVRPFVQGLVGAMRASADCKVAGISCSDLVDNLDTSSTNFMIQLGGGVAFPLTESVAGVAQVDYRRAFEDGDGANSVRVLVGARFGF